MFDITRLSEYRENNKLEVKAAVGGLPNSLWESYSAFANTDGGIILLGVKEKKDKSFEIVCISDTDLIQKTFWDTINNRTKVNCNILQEKNVYPIKTEKGTVIVIEVPRAERYKKPIYIGKDMFTGSYRRNWEGDYLLSREDVAAIFRDAGDISQDKKILTEMNNSVFCQETVKSFRNSFSVKHEGHIWNNLETSDFLCKIGAAALDENGNLHPTGAGLLMFGYEYEIVKEYPNYFLDYQEQYDASTRWSDRVISSSGDWSGNLFDFFFKIVAKLEDGIKRPFKLDGLTRIDDTSAHKAMREALVNCLVHADYYGRQGTVIKKTVEKIIFSNPGTFRIPVTEAFSGGISDPRNAILLKMFSFLELGERAGSGVPKIVDAMIETFGTKPEYIEKTNPDRVEMIFWLQKEVQTNKNKESSVKKFGENAKSSVKKFGENAKSSVKIIEIMKENPEVTLEEIAIKLQLSKRAVEKQVQKLRELNIITRDGSDRTGHWIVRK